MKHMTLESGQFFKMGDGKNWRVISPEMGAKQITLNYAVHAAGQEFPQHLHDDSEDIFVCLRGRTCVREGDRYYPMNPGDAVWIPAGDVHGSKNQFTEPAELFSFQSPPDMPLYRGQRDSTRAGARIPAPPPGHQSRISIRAMEEPAADSRKPGEWRRVFGSHTGSKTLALDHITLAAGQAVALPAEPRERVLVMLQGGAKMLEPAEEPIAPRDVLLLEPGDRLTFQATADGTTLVRAHPLGRTE
jgi:quercetin dioxygenase-like cupin family protein